MYRFLMLVILLNLSIVNAQKESIYLNQKSDLIIYDIKQNNKNFLWLATDIGVYKYDYVNFEKIDYISKDDDLIYFTSGLAVCYKSGKIFSRTKNNKIYQYDVFLNKFIEIYLGKKIISFEIVDENNLIINDENEYYVYNLINKKKKIIKFSNIKTDQIDFEFLNYNNFLKLGDVIYILVNNEMYQLNKNFSVKKVRSFNKNYFCNKINDQLYFVYLREEKCYLIYNNKHELKDKIIINSNLNYPKIIEYKKGLLIKDNDLLSIQNNQLTHLELLANNSIINIHLKMFFKDLSGNLWIYENGLYYINDKFNYYKICKNDNDLLSSMSIRYAIKDNLFFYTHIGDRHDRYILKMKDGKYETSFAYGDLWSNGNTAISNTYDNNIISFTNKEIKYIVDKNKNFKDVTIINEYLKKNNINIDRLHIPEDLIIIISRQDKIIIYDRKTHKIKTVALEPRSTFNRLNFKYTDNELYLLTSNNLFVCNYRDKTYKIYKLPKSFNRYIDNINDFHFHKNNLIFANKENNLYQLNLSTLKTDTILNSNQGFYSIFKDNKDRFWCQTVSNMFVFNYNTKVINIMPFPKFEFESYFIKNAFKDQIFYVFTNNHTIEVDTEKFVTHNTNENIILDKIIFTNKGKTIQKHNLSDVDVIEFPPNSYNLALKFSSPDYLINNFYSLKYRINKNEWLKLEPTIIINPSLISYGDYNLQIKNTISNKIIFEKKIIIKPKFIETIYFKIIVSFLFLVIIYVFFLRSKKNLKKELELKSFLEKTKVKQKVLVKVSHEIRTPLNVIIGFSDLLKNNNNSKDDIKNYSDAIYFAGNNLLHLINDYISKSALDDNKVIFEKKPLDLNETLDKISKFFSLKIKEKDLKFILQIQDCVPQKLIGDVNILTQILINLIQNAIKFTENGSITLSVNCYQQEEDHCIIEFNVIDTGIGIPKSKQNKIFEEFSQIHSTRKNEGSGLGLMISKELVEVVGGNIFFKSESFKGTTFTVRLPFLIHEFNQLEGITNENNNTENIFDYNQSFKILIAEDEMYNSLLINNLIKSKYPNVEILNVVNGLTAIEALEKDTFSIIILDLNMPYVSGIEVAKHLRENLDYQNKNLIYCSATSNDDLASKLRLYFDYSLSKPYKKEELSIVINKILQSNNE
jgi:signal transduction histidine kinase/CheY-like chemotaxis protein